MIYDKVKEACKKKGISISTVESEAGLGNGTISKWSRSVPTTKNLIAVAKVLEMPLEFFLEDSETK